MRNGRRFLKTTKCEKSSKIEQKQFSKQREKHDAGEKMKRVLPDTDVPMVLTSGDYHTETEFYALLQYMLADEFRNKDDSYCDGEYEWTAKIAEEVGLYQIALSSEFIQHVQNFYDTDNKVPLSDNFRKLDMLIWEKERWNYNYED